jgi:ankyrin repeat protein
MAAQVNAESTVSYSDVVDAIVRGDNAFVQNALENGAPIAIENEEPLIYYAVDTNNTYIVRFLLEKCKCDPNAYSGYMKRDTVIMNAVSKNNPKMVKLLLDYGADPDKSGYSGDSAGSKASYKQNKVIIELILQHYSDEEMRKEYLDYVVCDAIHNNDIEYVKECIARGADINNARHPLFYAAEYGREEIVKYILSLPNFTSIDTQDYNGYSALYYAIIREHPNIVKLLVEKGCQIELRDNRHYYTPLTQSMFPPQIEVFKYLLSKGANPNARTMYGLTPYIWAALFNKIDYMDLLIQAKADIELKSDDGLNALLYCMKKGKIVNLPTLIHILDNGINPNETSIEGESAFYILPTMKMNEEDMLTLAKKLYEKGAMIKGDEKYDPIVQALSSGKTQLVEYYKKIKKVTL